MGEDSRLPTTHINFFCIIGLMVAETDLTFYPPSGNSCEEIFPTLCWLVWLSILMRLHCVVRCQCDHWLRSLSNIESCQQRCKSWNYKNYSRECQSFGSLKANIGGGFLIICLNWSTDARDREGEAAGDRCRRHRRHRMGGNPSGRGGRAEPSGRSSGGGGSATLDGNGHLLVAPWIHVRK